MPNSQTPSEERTMSIRRTSRGLAAAATVLALAAGAAGVAAPAAADVPTVPDPIEYDAYPAVADPGASSGSYFRPHWYDTDGRHIQAHGGQIVTRTAEEL